MVIMVLTAHSDDSVLGMGGTIAKYCEEGKRVIVVIYSAGEASPLWIKDKKKLIKTRITEAIDAHKVLGVKDTIFIGQQDAKLKKRQEFINQKTKTLLEKYQPDRIFVHHSKDLHPDHKSVWNACEHAIKNIPYYHPEVYGFEVNSWFTSFVRENQIVVNITKYQDVKVKALKRFFSQRYLLVFLEPMLFAKSFYYGSIYGFKYAEHFYRY